MSEAWEEVVRLVREYREIERLAHKINPDRPVLETVTKALGQVDGATVIDYDSIRAGVRNTHVEG